MAVRAKFKVATIEASQTQRLKDGKQHGDQDPYETVEIRTIVARPVIGGSEENKRFWTYSPSGELRLGTINPEAWRQFELGTSFYLDFTEARD